MLKSSLDFHTMTLSMALTEGDACQLIGDFLEYRRKTGCIQIYRRNEHGTYIKYCPADDCISFLPTDIKIYFDGRDRGIKWQIRSDSWFYGMVYIIEAIINPKILAGITDYLTAATYSDLNIAITNFNFESKKISPLLKSFHDYSLKRVDYCANIHLDEFIPGGDPNLIMNLIRRGDIPFSYKEWTQYDSTSHRRKSRPGSFYLINHSVNINYYSKYVQLQNRSSENVEKGHPPIPQDIIDAAQYIIRFEVQCKYHKTYMLSSEAEKSGNSEYNKYKDLLSPLNCIKVVSDYYKKVIGSGDWHTLQEAIRIIESRHFNRQKENRLVGALQLVHQYRSIAKAKASCQGRELEAFKRTLNELSSLNINPVTIPKDWNIKHIPNLLRAYFNRYLEEYRDINTQSIDACVPRGYFEYIEIFGSPPI